MAGGVNLCTDELQQARIAGNHGLSAQRPKGRLRSGHEIVSLFGSEGSAVDEGVHLIHECAELVGRRRVIPTVYALGGRIEFRQQRSGLLGGQDVRGQQLSHSRSNRRHALGRRQTAPIRDPAEPGAPSLSSSPGWRYGIEYEPLHVPIPMPPTSAFRLQVPPPVVPAYFPYPP